jgi:hypothetical protein
MVAGLLLPSISYIVGNVSTTFGKNNMSEISKDTSLLIKIVAGIAFALFLFSYLFYAIW